MPPSPPSPSEVRLALARRFAALGDAHVSGELLAGELGLSRAAVSNHLRVLREAGFAIEAAPRRGYHLPSWPDRLCPEATLPLLETVALGRSYRFVERCPSTNALAHAAALDGAPHGHTIVADQQDAGRGRLGRTWFSPPGCGLYTSVVLRPKLAPQEAPPLTLACAVAVAEVLEGLGDTPLTPRLKWPNDVQLDGQKVSGILLELAAEPERVHFVIAGIGLNVNTPEFPPELDQPVTSLRRSLDAPQCRPRLLAALLLRLEHWLDRLQLEGVAPIREAWLARAAYLGQRVRVRTPQGDQEGIAETLDDQGALLLRQPDGERLRVLAGDVHAVVDEQGPTR